MNGNSSGKDITPAEKKAGIIQYHQTIFPENIGRWFPRHITEGAHSGPVEQNVQSFAVAASLRSEIYADSDNPNKLLMVLKSDGITFSSDRLMRDQVDKRWLMKIRTGIAFLPIVPSDAPAEAIALVSSCPQTENKVTNISETLEFGVNASLDLQTSAKDGASGGASVGVNHNVKRNIQYSLTDFGYVNTSQRSKINDASWEWYLSKITKADDGVGEVRNTRNLRELAEDVLNGRTATHRFPSLAREGTQAVEVIALWRLDRKYWTEKKEIQINVAALAGALSINLPYTAEIVANDVFAMGLLTDSVEDSRHTYLCVDEKAIGPRTIKVDLSAIPS